MTRDKKEAVLDEQKALGGGNTAHVRDAGSYKQHGKTIAQLRRFGEG